MSANHEGPYFPIKNSKTGEEFLPPAGRYWVFNEEEVKRRIADGRIIFGKSGDVRPVQKVFLNEKKSLRVKPESWWDEHGLNENGTAELGDLIGTKIFVHSKPSITVKHVVNIAAQNNDIILDFFSGSGTTAQAVLELNKEDGGNRKFILVQLPEKCDEDSEAFKAGYKTIADIGKERIRRVIKKIQDDKDGKLDLEEKKQDLGFKVFKLSPSNFKIWRGADIDNEETLLEQLDAFTDPVKPGADKQNMLYELKLKAGYELTSHVEYVTLSDAGYYSINNNELVIALDTMSTGLIEQIIAAKPEKVITLDSLFTGNDQLKTNTVLQMRDAGIDFKVI